MKMIGKVVALMGAWMIGLVMAWMEARKRLREFARARWIGIRSLGMTPEPGIDGILVTVGLCIIALLLCVVMKNSLSEFIKSIVSSMTKEATDILTGTRV